VSKLELLDNIQLAHPFNKGFDYESQCRSEEEALRVAHGESVGDSATNGVVSETGHENGDNNQKVMVYTTSFYVGLVLDTSKCWHRLLACGD
jgi:poly(A) polymerase